MSKDRVEAADRQELETMRDSIVARMDALNGHPLDERERILSQEFGDYRSLLATINGLLHEKRRPRHRHAPVAALTVLFVVFLAGFAALLQPAMPTGAHSASLILAAGETTRLAGDLPMVITHIDAAYDGDAAFTLIVEDAAGKHVLLGGNAEEIVCTGCDVEYTPPYLLELRAEDGTLRLAHIGIRTLPP